MVVALNAVNVPYRMVKKGIKRLVVKPWGIVVDMRMAVVGIVVGQE